jgi:phosphoserine phosphatase RsbU/P
MRIKVRTKLIIAILVPLLTAYLGTLAINFYFGTQQAADQAQQHLTDVVENHALRLNNRFVTAEQAAMEANSLFIGNESPFMYREADVLLARSVLKNPNLYGAVVAIEPGAFLNSERQARYVCRAPLPPPVPPGDAKTPKKPGAEAPAKPPASSKSSKSGKGGSKPKPKTPARPSPAEFYLERRRSVRPSGRSTGPRPDMATVRNIPLRKGDLAKEDPDYFEEAWYEAPAVLQTVVWSEPRKEEVTDGPVISRCSVPLFRDEEFLGVVAFDVMVRPLQEYVRRTRLEGGYCVLIGPRQQIIAHPNMKLAMAESLYSLAESRDRPELAELADAMASKKTGVRKIEDFHTGKRSWVVYTPISAPGWSFAVVVPEAQIMGPVYAKLRRGTAFMLGGLGGIIILLVIVSIHITRPITRLTPVVRAVAAGDLTARVENVNSHDEIGEFAETFNMMVADLNEHVAALTDETAAREAVESELRVAREIQSSLLPHTFPPFPHRPEFDLHAVNVAAKQVAGDFFDFFFVDDDVLAFLIADVSGKGIPAALFMAVARTVIRNQAMTGASPAEVMHRTNHLLFHENERDMFVTVFFAHYHTKTGELTYANAGHNPPLLGTPAGDVTCLEGSTGCILGVFEDLTFGQRKVLLGPGDQFVLYTDGVTEAMDAEDNQFSLERLERIVGGNTGASPEEMCGLTVETVEAYRAHAQQDDVTMLVLRRNL